MIKTGRKILYLLITLLVLISVSKSQVSAKSEDSSSGDIDRVISGILTCEQNQVGVVTAQELIDTGLAQGAGNSNPDWLVIGLSRYMDGLDYTNYISALNTNSAEMKSLKATDLQRIALVYSAVGDNEAFINATIRGSVGKLGVMSYIYALILMDSRDYVSKDVSREDILRELMKLQLKDGGWALSGELSDIDVTAMVLQALASYYEDKTVKASVNKALALLSKRQEKTGDYKSWGTRCCESTAQVLTALAALNMDYRSDQRFIKDGHTLFDGLLLYQQEDGGFSHSIDGKSDRTASVQAMYSLIAVQRQEKGLSSFYNFSNTDKLLNFKMNLSVSKAPDKVQDKVQVKTSEYESDKATNKVSDKTTEKATDKVADKAPDKAEEAASGDNSSSKPKVTLAPSPTEGTGANATIAQSGGTLDQGTARRNPMDYHSVITIITLAAALLLLGILRFSGRHSKRKFITVLAVAGVVLAAVWGIKFQSVEDYYKANPEQLQVNGDTATLSIRCDTIAGQKDHIPEDGCILDTTQFPVKAGDSVLDILILATKNYKIPLDYTGSSNTSVGSAYVKGLDDIYEQEFGAESGWLYRVNGEFPGISSEEYKVKTGDVIEWVYTCDFGKDVGRQ